MFQTIFLLNANVIIKANNLKKLAQIENVNMEASLIQHHFESMLCMESTKTFTANYFTFKYQIFNFDDR